MKNTSLPTVGIIGAGQLAMMMAEAYQQLGGSVTVLADDQDSPAVGVANNYMVGDSHNVDQLVSFFETVDLVTLENEFVDSQLLIDAMTKTDTQVFPDPHRYKLIEDKLSENQFFEEAGVPIADFFVVNSADDLVETSGYLKLAKGGYDGIGTYRVEDKAQATEVFNRICSSGTVIFEHEMRFAKELSLIAVASSNELIFYPLVETHQDSGTCRYVSFPSGENAELEQRACAMVEKIMRALNTRGLFAFELFLTEDGELFVNESAPRPHNSGHITLDSMNCSQFENHMRSVVDLPLVQPVATKNHAIMINLLGTRNGEFDAQQVLNQIDDKDLAVTFYGKRQSRVNRKMGHINLWGDNSWERAENLVRDLEI